MKTRRSRAAAPERAPRVKTFFSLLIPSLDDIRDRAPLAPPLAAGWIVSAAAALSLRTLLLGGAAAQDGAAAAAGQVVFWAMTILAPVVLLTKAGLLTALAWSLLALLEREARFRQLLSIFLYGEAIVALRGVFGPLYLRLAGGAGEPSGAALTNALGLSSLVSPDRPALVAAAQTVSLAHLAWAIFVSLAIGNALALRVRSAAALAAALWAAVVATAALRATLLT